MLGSSELSFPVTSNLDNSVLCSVLEHFACCGLQGMQMSQPMPLKSLHLVERGGRAKYARVDFEVVATTEV